MNFLRGEGNSPNLVHEEGEVFINHQRCTDFSEINRSVGYVTQDIILEGYLTVNETLYYTSRFK